MTILAIDTSADETSVAITEGRKVMANVIYSQVLLHKKWGGIYPSLAKRAHEERIDWVVNEALYKCEILNPKLETNPNFQNSNLKNLRIVSDFDIRASNLDCIAVTYGPGLAVALEVGLRKAKELAQEYNKKLVAVNHLEGHIYSSFVQNSRGNPQREFEFPYLALVISGGHTEIVLFKDHITYEVLGETIDDAAGEALDKAAKLLGLGYPGGPVIERFAQDIGNKDLYHFPRPMLKSQDLNFSFSGLKTSFYYYLKSLKENEKNQKIKELVSSFQEAVFDTIIFKSEKAIKKTGINKLVVGGGVIANLYLRKKFRYLVKKYNGRVYFPPYKYLTGDNAAMIGVAAYYKAQKNQFVSDPTKLDRVPRLSLQ